MLFYKENESFHYAFTSLFKFLFKLFYRNMEFKGYILLYKGWFVGFFFFVFLAFVSFNSTITLLSTMEFPNDFVYVLPSRTKPS